MKKIESIFLAAIFGASLSGCGGEILDWDNARISGGKFYAKNDNEPFSGKITNVPLRVIAEGTIADLLSFHFENVEPADRRETVPSLICDLGATDGQRHGEIACRTTEGLVRLEGKFEDGTTVDKWTIYDSRGGVSLSAAFAQGKIDGRLEIYNPNGKGKLLSQGYKEGELDGTGERWLGNGNQVLSTYWSYGKENGLHREWWDYGNLKLEVVFKEGAQQGLLTYYNDDGSINRTIGPFQGKYARLTKYRDDGKFELWDIDKSGNYKSVVSSTARTDTQAVSSPNCLDEFISAYRREVGEEAIVTNAQANEWKEWCAEGRAPDA